MDVFIGQSKLQQYFGIIFPFSFLPEVTKILLFAAQASHQLVPPEVSTSSVFGDSKNGQQASTDM